MNLSERGAKIAAPIIASNESLRSFYHDLMLNGKTGEATHMVEVITEAERIARGPVNEGGAQETGQVEPIRAEGESLLNGHESTTVYSLIEGIY